MEPTETVRLRHCLAALIVMPPVGVICGFVAGAALARLVGSFSDSLAVLPVIAGPAFAGILSGWFTAHGLRDVETPASTAPLVIASGVLAGVEAVAILVWFASNLGR